MLVRLFSFTQLAVDIADETGAENIQDIRSYI